MKTIFVLALSLASCAAFAQVEVALPVSAPSTATPQCTCAAQCAAMWAKATQDVENASGMRLRLISDTMLQTYVTNNAGRQTGVVTKLPLPGGAYEIVLTLEPSYRGQKDVQETMRSNVELFNKHLNEIGMQNTCR